MNQGERLKTEKVELDEADLLHATHVVLRDDAAFFIDKQRQVIDQRQVGQDHAGRMGRGMAHQSFEPQGMIHQSFDPRIAFHHLAKPRLHFHRFGQWIIESLFRRGNQLCDGIGFCE